MGRKKKFSTDELIGFIKQYLIEHQSLELLMPTKVADYCRNVLHISIVYQSFTRDPLVKKWIDDYNTNLHQRVTNEIDGPSILPDISIDVEDAIYRYRNPEDMKQFLMEINRQIGKLSNASHQFAKQYQECSEQMVRLEEQNTTLIEQLTALNEKLSTLKAELKIMREQNAAYKKKNRAIDKYLNEYLNEPIMLKHLQELRLLSDKEKVVVPSCTDYLSEETMDFTESINRFYDVTLSVNRKSDDAVENMEETNSGDNYEENVISTKMTNLMDKFSNL